jgi:NtrC-family two-component system sensor histidine kinase KinB
MPGLRQKLLLAFAGLTLLLLAVAGLGTVVIGRVSLSFDRIFRENLASIDASREMQQAADEVNQALLLTLWEGASLDTQAIRGESENFERRLDFQRRNVTVTGEKEATDGLKDSWLRYQAAFAPLLSASGPLSDRRRIYLERVRPGLRAVQLRIRDVSGLNSRNILSADGQVRAEARAARNVMALLLLGGGALVLGLFYLLGKAILKPIRALTRSAQEIEQGNLDLALQVRSRDELGQLAEAFNAMTAKLREFRRTDQAKLIRTQRTTQAAIDSLPDAVAAIDAEGFVELSNPPARTLFGIKPGTRVDSLGMDWLNPLFQKVGRELRPFVPEGYQSAVQVFPEGKERFYLPHLIPILDETRHLHGVTLVLADVTGLRKLDESKSDLLATVSHELKTRLTSFRMAVHLLLDEKMGELNGRQSDLLLTAREDAERLHRIIEGLLDIGRIRSGNLKMRLQPMDVRELAAQSMEASRHACLDKGLKLESEIPPELPKILGDPSRIHLILANLLSNAVKYTPAGGSVRVRAARIDEGVAIEVSDTGVGIPAADVPRVFEKFYRGAREGEPGGAGLGLAIAKEVAEAHGGGISVESAEGVGTRFTFVLKPAPGDGAGTGSHGG